MLSNNLQLCYRLLTILTCLGSVVFTTAATAESVPASLDSTLSEEQNTLSASATAVESESQTATTQPSYLDFETADVSEFLPDNVVALDLETEINSVASTPLENNTPVTENVATSEVATSETIVLESDLVTSETVSTPVKASELPQSLSSAELTVQSSEEVADLLAQSDDLDEIKEELKIPPLDYATGRRYSPFLTFGVPSAFGMDWGDLFISAYGVSPGKARDGQWDGSLSTGFGIGDAIDGVGMSFTYNLGSINNFGDNGTFDLQGHRTVYRDSRNQVAIAAGWASYAQHGNEPNVPSGAYGTVTSYTLLRPDDPGNKLPLLLSVGVGGGPFRQNPESAAVFGGAGLQVHSQVGVGLFWTGLGLNFGVSYVPMPTIPLTISAQGVDLTDNSPGGTRFLMGLSYGFNFLPGQ